MKLACHFVHASESLPQHSLARSDLNVGVGITRSVAAFGRGFNRGKVVEVAVGVPQKKGVLDGASVFPVDLKINERFARHPDQSDPVVQQDGRYAKIDAVGRWILYGTFDGRLIMLER